ncbi:hypothetical protein U0070_009190, partial [Myodes glareolus]
ELLYNAANNDLRGSDPYSTSHCLLSSSRCHQKKELEESACTLFTLRWVPSQLQINFPRGHQKAQIVAPPVKGLHLRVLLQQ